MTPTTAPTLTEYLLAAIEAEAAAARMAAEVCPARWKAQECTAHGWRNSRLGNEPTLPFVVSDDEHGSLMMASIWPEDGIALPAHIARHDPAHVLAVCAAHKAIVERLDLALETAPPSTAHHLRATLRALASAYAGRPGWQESWSA